MEINVKTVSKSTLWGVDFLVIFVSLGTQDRSFKRLLEAIEHQIDLGNIKDRVVVQSGVTSFESKHMEIFDLVSMEEYGRLIEECDILICHGGVGTIIDGLKKHKKIIAAARLKEYNEHQNNHQKQIIHEFVKNGLILELDHFEQLGEKLEELKTFKPNEYESNTLHFIEDLEGYINSVVHKGVFFQKFMFYAFYFVLGMIFQFICLAVCQSLQLFPLTSLCISVFILLCYRFIIHCIFFSNKKRTIMGEFWFLFFQTLQILLVWYFEEYFVSQFLFKILGMTTLSFLFIYFFNVVCGVKDVE